MTANKSMSRARDMRILLAVKQWGFAVPVALRALAKKGAKLHVVHNIYVSQ